MNSSITIERKRVDCNSLPKGWQREEVLRKSGISAGKVDVYYYSPTGKKIESKPQLARCLGDAIDIGAFDFQSGKFVRHMPPPSISLFRCSSTSNHSSGPSGGASGNDNTSMPPPPPQYSGGNTLSLSVCSSPNSSQSTITNANILQPLMPTTTSHTLKRKFKAQSQSQSQIQNQSQTHQLQGMPSNVISSGCAPSSACGAATTSAANSRQQLEFSRTPRTDASLVPPIRQTASIFKQPVTVIRNHEPTKVRNDNTKQASGQEKPKQMFWEKRLEGLRACHPSGEEFDDIVLPKSIRTIGPNVNEQTVLQSLATALHVLNVPVMGQASTKTEMNKNATAFLNPEQPLMQAVLVSDDDIRRQEDRVNVARKKLQDALKA
ncbi:methyl-CpG-binding domain protein 2 isoform X1 [Bactrocera neohumeralis]|uniref:methyl-CpG-binding domain protein 2 isoform X1 n=1 Tax=Bactrocera tryoni TaxID=59916 RepID=UPI001A95AAEC|nr:methyl-CpG-binding domain protein 2 isoform X1 [Bactrocera tryoni]XP_050322276.1 methyl-CpG-binding domain protein 2 isoform X1 [Bactrocera neohumeralis]